MSYYTVSSTSAALAAATQAVLQATGANEGLYTNLTAFSLTATNANVENSLTVQGPLSAYGTLSVQDTVFAHSNSIVSGDLSVNGNSVTAQGTIFAKSNSIVVGDFHAKSNSSVDGNLSVAGTVTSQGTLFAKSDCIVSSNLSVTGSSMLAGSLTSGGFVTAQGTIFANSNIIVSGDFYAKNNSFLGGNFFVTGSSVLSGNLTSGGSITSLGTLFAKSDGIVSGDLFVFSNVSALGNLSIGLNALCESNLSIIGTCTIGNWATTPPTVKNIMPQHFGVCYDVIEPKAGSLLVCSSTLCNFNGMLFPACTIACATCNNLIGIVMPSNITSSTFSPIIDAGKGFIIEFFPCRSVAQVLATGVIAQGDRLGLNSSLPGSLITLSNFHSSYEEVAIALESCVIGDGSNAALVLALTLI